MNDFELWRDYAAQGAEDAFATLVNRYVRLVYSAAFRQCGHVQDAEEITQAVFVILARKADGLRPDTVLPAWLLRTTRFVAMNARRRQLHRLPFDRDEMNENPAETDPAWQQMAPVLDEALDRLSVKDRNAVVLRYFEQRSFKEIAQLTAGTEDGAQKRVTRALEKLRAQFAKRGLLLSSVSILTAISANAVQTAPAHLTTTVVAAVRSGTALTGGVAVLVKASLVALNAARLNTLGLCAATAALAVVWLFVSGSVRENPLGIPVNPTTLFWRSIVTSADGAKLVGTVSDVASIYFSTDPGATWHTTGARQGLWHALASSADGTSLLALGSNYRHRYDTNGTILITFATDPWVYISANSGANWARASVTSRDVWTAVASSADGRKLVVGARSGEIYTSTNAGGNWTLRSTPNKQWKSIASSADGTRLVAVAVKGGIHTSADSGVTWTPTSAPSDLWWWDVASSTDGGKLVAVAIYSAPPTAGSIYVSTNAGLDWVLTSAPSNHWGSVASSADATTLAAVVSFASRGVSSGVIGISRNSGTTWAMTNAGTNWNSVTVSADGKKIFAARDSGGIQIIAR